MWNANLLDCRRDEPKLYSIRVGLYANVLRLSRRCRFGLARNCTGSPTWPPFVAWTGSELRHLIRMHGISSAACRFAAIENSECIALRQQSSRREQVPEVSSPRSRAINE
jgi:hypothetical protein